MADEDSDYTWQPPSEAEMKIIRARRERDNKISQRMGDYLLKGYKMLGTVCTCGTILLQDRNGSNYCIACSELDSDADKDDPVRNQEAALAQVREQELSSQRQEVKPELSSQSHESQQELSALGVQLQNAHKATYQSEQRAPAVNSHDAQGSSQPSLNHYPLPHPNPFPRSTSGALPIELSNTVDILNRKIAWAADELRQTVSVEYSIQLCQLIKHSADAIHSLQLTG